MPAQLSRRAVVTSTVAGAALLGTAASKTASAETRRPLAVSGDQALHAARRLTFGATPALVADLRAKGLTAWLDEQLGRLPEVHGAATGPMPDVPVPNLAAQMMDAQGRGIDLKAATFARAAWGDRQVYELLVEFWSNHLSIHAGTVGALKLADDRAVVRAHALGTFTDMLLASCQSPAMLRYLNNDVSRGHWPNENYARELLELHTVGVRARYTPAHVRDAARALTGLTIDPNTQEFRYRPEWHDVGRLRVLGWTHANTDPAKGLEVATSLVRYLASHPSTAHSIATKLVRRLVGDPVPSALVASAAKTYLANRTAIVPTVRHIVLSRDFARSAGRKSQRPFDWVTAAVRSLGLQQDPKMLTNATPLLQMLQRLGQAPFEWVQPDGYPDRTGAWTSTSSMLARWNTAQQLVNGGIAGLRPLDSAAVLGTPVPTTAGALADRIVQRVLGAPTRPALKTALLLSVAMASSKAISEATAKALTPQLAALVISSPEAMVR